MDQENQGHQTILSPSSASLRGLKKLNVAQAFKIDQWSNLGKMAALFILAFLVYFTAKAFLVEKVDTPSTSPQNVTQNGPSQSTFNFASIPSQAWVYINGEKKGVTPLEIVLPTQKFIDLEIRKEGFITVKKEFQTNPETTEQTIQLEKVKPTLGQINVNSNPDQAKIFVDNEDTGLNTPALIQNLQINQTYKIVLKKEGYRSTTNNLLIEKDQHEISVDLEKLTATIKVHTIPSDAVISIDGKTRSHTIEGLVLNKTYTMEVSKPGYETVKKSVPINNNYIEMDIELKVKEIKKGLLSVSATPWAQVIVDGNVVGPSPILNFELTIGTHELILRHPDFEDVKKTIQIEENKNAKIIIDLRNP